MDPGRRDRPTAELVQGLHGETVRLPPQDPTPPGRALRDVDGSRRDVEVECPERTRRMQRAAVGGDRDRIDRRSRENLPHRRPAGPGVPAPVHAGIGPRVERRRIRRVDHEARHVRVEVQTAVGADKGHSAVLGSPNAALRVGPVRREPHVDFRRLSGIDRDRADGVEPSEIRPRPGQSVVGTACERPEGVVVHIGFRPAVDHLWIAGSHDETGDESAQADAPGPAVAAVRRLEESPISAGEHCGRIRGAARDRPHRPKEQCVRLKRFADPGESSVRALHDARKFRVRTIDDAGVQRVGRRGMYQQGIDMNERRESGPASPAVAALVEIRLKYRVDDVGVPRIGRDQSGPRGRRLGRKCAAPGVHSRRRVETTAVMADERQPGEPRPRYADVFMSCLLPRGVHTTDTFSTLGGSRVTGDFRVSSPGSLVARVLGMTQLRRVNSVESSLRRSGRSAP